MRLRDLFRRRAEVPDLVAPAPARRPDWPTMPPVQRVIGSPDLITAPDRFTDSLVSWRNPSRGGTLGHYVTPDAPAGLGAGLATVFPRAELPAPARPWWWPRSPAVQRHVPTPTPVPAAPPASPNDQAPAPSPAVPVSALAGHALVSAAGAEPPSPRWTAPAVQRAPERPASVPDPSITAADVPAGESPLEIPLPLVVAPQTGPAPDASARSAVTPSAPSPGCQPDLPSPRRLGLGAPLQRVPDPEGEPAAGGTTVHREIEEAGAQPTDVAPLLSDFLPVGSAPTSPMSDGAATPSATTAATSLPTPAAPAGGGPSVNGASVQRQVALDAEPTDVVPLVSDSPPMAPVAASSMPPKAVTEPSAKLAAGSPAVGPSPSPGSPTRSIEPGPVVQRAADTAPQQSMGPVRWHSAEPTSLPTPAAPTGNRQSVGNASVHHQVEVGATPTDVAPLVSDSPPLTSTATSLMPSDAVTTPSVQRAADSTAAGIAPQRESSDVAASPSSHLPASPATAHPGGVAPVVVGLVSDRLIEPVVSRYSGHVATVNPAVEQSHWPAVQGSMGAGGAPAASWLPGVLPVRRPSPGIDRPGSPTPPAPFAAAPIGQASPPELATELVMQRADNADEPAAATNPMSPTSPTAAASPAGVVTPAPPAGSTSPTDVDTLVRRLYDPIVRRIKAELQLGRERAGHSLDLRH